MKHVVNLVVSQPDHEFISMRSRRHEKTCIQEANTPEEAMNRATRRYKSLGFYVHGASIVEQKVEVPSIKPLTEGVAETETAISAAQDKLKKAKEKATAEVDKSEVQDKAGKAQAGSALAAYLKKKAEKLEEQVDQVEQLDEKKMTDAQMKRREEIVKGMKPLADWEKRYPDRGKEVMYATATKMAMAEEAVQEGRVMGYKMSRSSVAGDRGDSKGGEINVSQKDREEIAKILGAKDDKKQDKKLEENAELEEAVSRKDFKQVAGIIKEIPDAAKRKEIAQHHAEIFANQNPRFDRSRFYAAAGVNLREEAEQVEEGAKNNPDLPRKHTSWFVKPPKGSRTFGKEFRMADKDKAEAHAMDIGGSVHKMDQYGSTMKEEVEQIDELNKETLASYIGKAAHSVGTKERIAKGLGQNAATTTSKKKREMYLNSAKTWRDAAARRVAGIKTAAGKLAKEEVEQVEEAKADPVAKAKELLNQAEKGTYKGSAKALQAALEKAKSRNFDQGKGYKLEEDAEQLDETGVVKKTNKTLKNLMAASKGAKINAAMGAAKMDPADYGYDKAQHLNKAIGRVVSRGAAFVEEGAEGTAPTTPKEKELAAKAGDPNKITKKDVLAARGVKLDEVKGSAKDIATEKAEDERLAKKEVKDSKSAKVAQTLVNIAKGKKNKINTSPSIEAHHTAGGK